MSNFRVGEKVVCVVPTESGSIKKDKVYTVFGLHTCSFTGKLGLILKEATPAHRKKAFWCWRFRPIDELSNTTYDEVMQWIESGQPIETLN